MSGRMLSIPAEELVPRQRLLERTVGICHLLALKQIVRRWLGEGHWTLWGRRSS